jgi:hypothetical protein
MEDPYHNNQRDLLNKENYFYFNTDLDIRGKN